MIKGKGGVSVVIGYVLLIIIGISIALLVYTWLKSYLPKEVEECPESVSLAISDHNCTTSRDIKLTLKNNGLFNIEGFIMRIRNEPDGLFYTLKGTGEEGIENYFIPPLKPNQEAEKVFSYLQYNQILEIKIEPFVENKEIILCDKAIISELIDNCK